VSVNYGTISSSIEEFIKREMREATRAKAIVGLSGGLDSSVTACLAVRALGKKNVLALILPDFPITPEFDVVDATNHAKHLDIDYVHLNINDIKSGFLAHLPKNQYAEGNLAARIRMCILYYSAFIHNGLVLGTSNKSELLLGYYTKFGDGAADLFPLGDLYKTQVRTLAQYLELPASIRQKKSSPRLWKDQMAEQEIGIYYDEIDNILRYLESVKNTRNDLVPTKDKFLAKNKEKIEHIIEKNAHKARPLRICKIPGN
jgi:NAD+ synthase